MLVAIIELFLLFRNMVSDKINRFIYAVSVWMALLFVSTEILSVFKGITTRNLWILWGVIDAALLFAIITQKCIKKEDAVNWKTDIMCLFKNKLFLCAGVYFILMLWMAIEMVPYNYDSMTYHCSRLFHWMQNASVEHYASGIERQVASPVLGAFVNLHVYVMLGGNDVGLNLLQCMSYLANGIIVYHITRKLSCQREYCFLAAVLFYSMPIAFAEALTTQVDNFATLWLLSFVYLLLDVIKSNEKLSFRKDLGKVEVLSLCVAFGYLTKPSVGIAMVVLVLWLLIASVRRKDAFLTVISLAGCAAVTIAAFLGPELFRNLITFQALSAPGVGARQLIGDPTEKRLLVNCVKNFTFNMPCIWMQNSSEMIWKYVMRLAAFLEIDINNPAISEDGREFMVHAVQTYGCDTAINPVIVWLLLVSFLLLLIKIYRVKKVNYKGIKFGYYISATVSFILFCAVLRWEPFVSRYMLSYLALLCPAIVSVIEWFDIVSKRNKSGIMFRAVIYFLCVIEMIGLFSYHGQKAFAGARDNELGYFAERTDIYHSYKAASDYINQKEYKQIGLYLAETHYEYPLLQMLENCERIEHVNVRNATNIYEDETFIPDVIFVYSRAVPENMECNGSWYEVVTKQGDVAFLMERIEK